MAAKVITKPLVIGWPHLAEPQSFDGTGAPETAKYSLTMYIPKNDKATLDAIGAAYEQAVREGRDKSKSFKPTPLYRPAGIDGARGLLKDEDDTSEDKKSLFPDHYSLTVKSRQEPDVLCKGRGTKKLTKEEIETEVYAGSICRVSFNIAPYTGSAQGITCYLNAVFKEADGTRLAGRTTGAEDFADFIDQAVEEFM